VIRKTIVVVPGATVGGLTDSLSEYDSGAFAGMHDVWWHLWCVSSVGAPINTLCCFFFLFFSRRA